MSMSEIQQIQEMLEKLLKKNEEPVSINSMRPHDPNGPVPPTIYGDVTPYYSENIPGGFVPVHDSKPTLNESPLEEDLALVYRYAIDKEDNNPYTVEAVLLHQVLRILQRIESLMEAVADAQPPQHPFQQEHAPSLVFHSGEINGKETDQTQNNTQQIQRVRQSHQFPPDQQGNANKRRRRKGNRKNNRRPQ